MKPRIDKIIKVLEKEQIPAFITADPTNISYLTGFRSDATGYLLIRPGFKPVFFTHFIFENEASLIKTWDLVITRKNAIEEICQKLKSFDLKTITFDPKGFSWQDSTKLNQVFSQANIQVNIKSDLVEDLRAIKDPFEINQIIQAKKITYQALDFAKQIVDNTMSEKELCIEIEKFLRLKGDNQTAFNTIVSAGKNCAYPHHIPGNDKLKEPLFLIDLGAKHCGYCADLTRVFFSGKMPKLLQKILDIVRKAQEIGIKAAKPGIKACDLDKASRQYIEKQGFSKQFGHGLGHGVGLNVHEPPYLNPRSQTILKPGMVITIEPAIYIPGKFGVRWEDMILINNKKAEII